VRVGLIAHKLSFAPDFRQAGVSRYVEYLLRYLPPVLDAGDDLHAFVGPEAGDPERMSSFDSAIAWHWTRWPTGRPPVRILWEQVVAPIAARRAGVDVLHGPVNVVPLLGATPSIVTVHDLAFLRFPEQYPTLQRRYLHRLTRQSVMRANLTIAVSGHTRADIVELLDADPERVIAVPNGVDDEFSPRHGTAELDEFRKERALPEEFILFVGTLQPRKNLEGLIRAYARLDPAERLPLVVVGSPGWMYQGIFDTLAGHRLEREVIFAGYADSGSLPLWYSAASVFVYPSLYEGFGLPVLEAMACGTPVITSDTSSLPEVAGDAALTVDPTDVDAISTSLRRLLNDGALRDDLRRRGVQRARAFSWRRTAERTANLYRRVAG
jgi:glycosyltransferase involved in cell wall biosynthesis